MKKKVLSLLAASFLAGALFIGGSVYGAANPSPGSETDPLVSKSYVDAKYNELLAMLSSGATVIGGGMDLADKNAIVTEVLAQVRREAGGSETYTPVFAKAGVILTGEEGAEIILRSGAATAYCPGENGMVNATTGQELYHGNKVEKNHLLIVPRNDGRGVKALEDSWFIIKGGYEEIQ